MRIFNLPDLGEGLPDAEIVEWHVKEGDIVKVDDLLVSMETAKALVEIPSPYAGKITQLHGKVGDIILTGSPLVSFEADSPSADTPILVSHLENTQGATVAGQIEVGNKILEENATGINPIKNHNTHVKALPAVRAMAKLLNIDLNTVKGSGKQGEITLEDLKKESHLCERSEAIQVLPTLKKLDCFVANAPRNDDKNKISGTTEPLRGMRRAMAQAMVTSHAEVVPVTVFDDANIHAWQAGTDITYRVLRAIKIACQTEPALNAHLNMQKQERILFEAINIGIAMDSDHGLFVPVLKNVETLNNTEIRAKINIFKEAVKNRSINPQDLQGSTIQLSNFGMFAGRYATPIVIPPTIAIIGTGKIRQQPIEINGKIVMHKYMPLSLSVDHRAVTGAETTRFLKFLIEDLEKNV
jgi:2-oxoisovalerate dehydrogenase E2 component (dihydrolipoyl transacylase)